jgi:mannonate dehydratase
MMEAPFVNRDATETNICGTYPIVENGYALPLEGPGLGISFNEEAAAATPFKPRTMPKLDAPDGSVRDW